MRTCDLKFNVQGTMRMERSRQSGGSQRARGALSNARSDVPRFRFGIQVEPGGREVLEFFPSFHYVSGADRRKAHGVSTHLSGQSPARAEVATRTRL